MIMINQICKRVTNKHVLKGYYFKIYQMQCKSKVLQKMGGYVLL